MPDATHIHILVNSTFLHKMPKFSKRIQGIRFSIGMWLLSVSLPCCCYSLQLLDGCPSTCDEITCLSSIVNQASCPEGTFYREKVVCGCCSACIKFRSETEICNMPSDVTTSTSDLLSESNSVITSSLCEPGLLCDEVCIVDEGTCFSYNHQNKVLTRPSCDPDGGFAAVQCKGDFINGRCFCYDKGGHRIFGQDWWKDAANMTCACSREVSSILSQGDRTDVSLHCSPNGNYEEMQCDDGLCWCANSTTGLPIAVIVPEKMISMLPCADKIEENTQYLRQCESISISVNHIKDISKKHGTIFSSAAMDKCDADGSYGAVQIIERQAHCSKKDKTALGSFQAPINEMNEMDCNCARDGDLYEQNDLLFFMDCAGNGDYKALQAADNKHFCVDSDGYPTTEMGDFTECPVFPFFNKMADDIGLRNTI